MAGELVLNQAFAFEVIDGLVRLLRTTEDVLQRLYGLRRGSPNIRRLVGKTTKVDVFDNARQALQAVMSPQDYPRGSASAAGKFEVTCISFAEQWLYEGEDLDHLRAIGGPSTILDELGREYLGAQLLEATRKTDRTRDVTLAALFRDQLYLKPKGNAFVPTFTSAGAVQVPTGIPATHKNQVNGNISATWLTATTNIVNDKDAVFRFAANESGVPPTWWLWNSYTWDSCILGNTQIKNLAGTSNVLWTDSFYDPTTGVRMYRLAGMPEVLHIIYDGVVDLDGATVKIIPDNMVIMTPPGDPSQVKVNLPAVMSTASELPAVTVSDWLRGLEGSAMYGPLPGDTEPRRVFGSLQYFDWEDNKTETILEQNINDCFAPYLRLKKAIYPATVIF